MVIGMKYEQKINPELYKRMFENIPTVSMKIFSWFKNTKQNYEVE